MLPLQNTTQQPEAATLSDRATRQAIFENSWNRAEHGDANDTRDTIRKLAQLRAQRAKLLGFSSYAAWSLENQMAKTPENALKFMDALVPIATGKAASEAKDIQAVIDAQKGGFTLQPWDWDFYSEQVRKAKYDLNDAEVKPYFEINNVLENGVFYAATQLYGITFKERKDIPGVSVRRARLRGVRRGRQAARAFLLRLLQARQQGRRRVDGQLRRPVETARHLPVVYNVANFTKPAPGEPALISFTDVTTMFHEFGHALHGMFANTEYPELSGTSDGARLRGVPLAVQRALGDLSVGVQPLRASTTRPASRCPPSWWRR